MSFDNFESGYLCACPFDTVQILRDIHVTAGASCTAFLPSLDRVGVCVCPHTELHCLGPVVCYLSPSDV